MSPEKVNEITQKLREVVAEIKKCARVEYAEVRSNEDIVRGRVIFDLTIMAQE